MGELKLDSRRRRRVKYCPCGKSNKNGKFVPFIDHEDKGFCHSCDKSFFPAKSGDKKESWRESEAWKTRYKPPEKIDYIPNDLFTESLGKDNDLIDYLMSKFDEREVVKAVTEYEIGTWQESFGWPHWSRTVAFWQIDIKGNIRQVKVVRYDPQTGRREKINGLYLVGARLITMIRKPNLKQCFFGEHLLSRYPSKVVGIVESEKTAIISSILYPKVLWLATGGSNGCSWSNKSTYQVLKGRTAVLYPDNDQCERWIQEVSQCGIKNFARVSVCRQFYDNMKPGEEKFDLADYLLRSFEAGVRTSKTDQM